MLRAIRVLIAIFVAVGSSTVTECRSFDAQTTEQGDCKEGVAFLLRCRAFLNSQILALVCRRLKTCMVDKAVR